MNILKHMEAVFLVTLGIAGVASVAVETLPEAYAKAPASSVAGAAAPANMPVVVVSAKRMSAEEKLQSLREESKLASVRAAAGSNI